MKPALTAIAASLLMAAALGASGPSHAQLAPRLIATDSAGSQTPDFSLPSTPLVTPVTQLRLRFDGPLAGVTAAAFRVVGAGADAALQTTACTALPNLDDVFVAIDDVHWDPALREATLQLDAPRGLPRGHYRLLACDTLQSLAGLALDGDGDGLAGGDARQDFAIEQTPALANPGFDGSLLGWSMLAGPGSTAVHDVASDADSARRSGALRLTSTAGGVRLGSASCFDLSALAGWNDSSWRLRLRYRVLSGNVRVTASFSYAFGGDRPPFECLGPGFEEHVAFDAGPTPDFRTFDSGWRPFEPLPNGGVGLWVIARDGQPFEILLDDIGLRFDADIIFRDTFD